MCLLLKTRPYVSNFPLDERHLSVCLSGVIYVRHFILKWGGDSTKNTLVQRGRKLSKEENIE